MPREGSHYICVSMVLINFPFKIGKNYSIQVLLEECKYIFKEKEVARCITEDLEMPLINLNKKILMKNKLESFEIVFLRT